MFEQMSKNWREFQEDKPGQRFRDRYDRNQQRERGRFDAGRLVNLTVGPVLVIFSVFFGWAPGPGMLTLLIGLSMVASEFRPAAVFLDWAEVELRRLAHFVAVLWRASVAGKALIIMTIVVCGAALGYVVYRVFFA